MKTLKKTLCLVLAVVLVVGVLILPAAADSTTATKDDAKAKEAYETLQKYDVMKGVDAEGKADLEGKLTRAMVAAIVYRIMTGDTLDTKVANFVDKADVYTDTIPGWAKGYVGYVTDAGIFGGYSDGSFKADNPVTGQELLKVMLVCIGYGKEGELVGEKWAVNTTTLATKVGMLDKVYTINIDLTKELTRGEVSKILVNAVKVPRVSYDVNGGYSYYQNEFTRPQVPNSGDNPVNTSLITEETTGGVKTTTHSADVWGIPSTTVAVTEIVNTWMFRNPVAAVSVTKKTPASSTTTPDAPLYNSFDTEDMCDIAKKIGLTKSAPLTVYENGVKVTEPKTLDITAEDTMIGAKARHTLIYQDPAADPMKGFILVYIDTYLGKVTKLAVATGSVGDKNEHELEAGGAGTNTVVVEVGGTTKWTLALKTLPAGVMKNDYVLVNYCEGVDATTKKVVGVTPDPTVDVKTVCAAVTVPNVSIKEITKNSAGTAIGFVDANGKQYYYSNEYAQDVNSKIAENAIGKVAFDLTTDNQGFVLAVKKSGVTDTNIGVILSRSIVEFSEGEYGYSVTVLLPNNTQQTIKVGSAGQGGKGYSDKKDAEANLTYFDVGSLIHFTTGEKANYVLDGAKVGASSIEKSATVTTGKILPGRVDIGDTYANDQIRSDTPDAQGFLVNDQTVVFLAQYAPDNTTTTDKNDYKLLKYEITNFKALPVLEIEKDSKIYIKDGKTLDVHQTNLDVQAFSIDEDGNLSAPGVGKYADFVVINGATKQTYNPATLSVLKYAFIYGNAEMVQVGDTYFTFNAFVNGVATKLNVRLNDANGVTAGLYTYGDVVNGDIYTSFTKLDSKENVGFAGAFNDDFCLAKNTYTYGNGVLTDTANKYYYTVATDCVVYTVARKAQEAHKTVIEALDVYDEKDIYLQFDKNGQVSLIYIDLSTAPTPDDDDTPAKPKGTFDKIGIKLADGVTVTADKTLLSEIEFVYDSTNTKSSDEGFYGSITVIAKWQAFDKYGRLTDLDPATTLLKKDQTYRLTLTLGVEPKEADTSIYSFDGGANALTITADGLDLPATMVVEKTGKIIINVKATAAAN